MADAFGCACGLASAAADLAAAAARGRLDGVARSTLDAARLPTSDAAVIRALVAEVPTSERVFDEEPAIEGLCELLGTAQGARIGSAYDTGGRTTE